MLTAQQIFDRVVAHIRAQREQAKTKGTCGYRITRKGKPLMCVVGCLIPNKAYSPQIEGLVVDNILCRNPDELKAAFYADSALLTFARGLEAGGVPYELHSLRMLSHLQSAHDSYDKAWASVSFIESFEEHAEQIALRFGVTYTPPTRSKEKTHV